MLICKAFKLANFSRRTINSTFWAHIEQKGPEQGWELCEPTAPF